MKYLFTLIGIFFITNINAQCLAGDCENGYGIYEYKGDIYRSGNWKDGKESGFAIVTTKSFRSFRNGKGLYSEYYFESKKELVIDKKAKKGFIIDLSTNNFFKVTLNTQGQIVSKTALKNNNTKQGCVAGDCENGIGVYVDAYSYLVATFVNGNVEGFGYSYIFVLGENYIGEYSNNYKNGIGIYYYKKWGNFYLGNFIDGKQSGKGVRHLKVSKYKEGIFKNGKIIKVLSSTMK